MTPALAITPQQHQALLALLRQFIPGVAVWAYGSRIKGTSHSASDLDLIAFTTPQQRRQFGDLKDALDESNLPFIVSVHVWDEEPEWFQQMIAKEHVVIQEAAKSPDALREMGGQTHKRLVE